MPCVARLLDWIAARLQQTVLSCVLGTDWASIAQTLTVHAEDDVGDLPLGVQRSEVVPPGELIGVAVKMFSVGTAKFANKSTPPRGPERFHAALAFATPHVFLSRCA